MMEFLLSFPTLFSDFSTQLWVMFISSFISATVFPANSELIFNLLSAPLLSVNHFWSMPLFWLWFVASLGNTLGGVTTYELGRLFTTPKTSHRKTQWAITMLKKYGAVMLLLSWVPVIGDLLCALAGWLRLNRLTVICFMWLGKSTRYALLAYGLYTLLPFP